MIFFQLKITQQRPPQTQRQASPMNWQRLGEFVGSRWVVGFVVGLAIALLTATGLQAAPPPPDYYPFPLNGRWEYATTNAAQGTTGNLLIKVIGADRDGSQMRYTTEQDLGFGPSNLLYLKGEGWVKEIKFVLARNGITNETVNDPIKPILKNPPKVGDQWSWTGQQVGAATTNASESFKAAAAEEVTVPAGKFNTIRVEITGEKAGTVFRKVMWYADRVGPVKWQIWDASNALQTTTELKRYEFPKAS